MSEEEEKNTPTEEADDEAPVKEEENTAHFEPVVSVRP